VVSTLQCPDIDKLGILTQAIVGPHGRVREVQQVNGYQFNDFDRLYPRLASSVDDNHESSMRLARSGNHAVNGPVSGRFATAPAMTMPLSGSPGPDFCLVTGGPEIQNLGTAIQSSPESSWSAGICSSSEFSWSAGIQSPSGSSWSAGIQESQVLDDLNESQVPDDLVGSQAPDDLGESQVSDNLGGSQVPIGLDERIRPEALVFDGGVWMIPRGCHR